MTDARLHVARLGTPAGGWDEVIATAALLAGAADVVEESSKDAEYGVDRVLAAAAATSEPVLVLPERLGPGAPGEAPVVRILVPVDRSPAEHALLRPWLDRAAASGLRVSLLHVLGERTRPPMWEGPGHHAEAWWKELRRRHAVASSEILVRSGDPAEEIGGASAPTDLLLVAWKGTIHGDHAGVVRALVAACRSPLLLVRASPGQETQPG